MPAPTPTFDPYAEWLQVPPGPRPPDHYALLGIMRTETDADRIQSAFRVRYAAVRKYQLKWPVVVSRILGELSIASLCLNDSLRREEYDRSLTASHRPPKPRSRSTTRLDGYPPVAVPPADQSGINVELVCHLATGPVEQPTISEPREDRPFWEFDRRDFVMLNLGGIGAWILVGLGFYTVRAVRRKPQ